MGTHWQPKNIPTITPAVAGGAGLIEFMQAVFGAKVLDRYDDQNGKVMHAELFVGDSRLTTFDTTEAHPLSPSVLHVYVPDVDATYHKALAAGAKSQEAPQDKFYGDRTATIYDPSGNRWSISTHQEDVTPEEMGRRMAEWEKAQA